MDYERILEDVIFIILLFTLPEVLLDKLGIYEAAWQVVKKRLKEEAGNEPKGND